MADNKDLNPQGIPFTSEGLPSPSPAVVEVEKGEFDPRFATVTGIVLGAMALIGVVLLIGNVSGNLSTLDADTAANPGSYAERLRTVAVVTALLAGLVALAAGIWLAALEVRGRLRKPEEPPTRVAFDAKAIGADATGALLEAVLKEGARVLDAMSKMRGTVAVLVVATLLLLGAMWTTGRPSDNSSPSPTATQTP